MHKEHTQQHKLADEHKDEFMDAVHKDLNKPAFEAYLSEVQMIAAPQTCP